VNFSVEVEALNEGIAIMLEAIIFSQSFFQLNVKIYIPHRALQDYVLNISTVHAVLPDGIRDAVSPYPPTPFQSLMFYCNDPVSMGRAGEDDYGKQALSVLIGPQYSRVNVKVHHQLRAIRVDFLPGGLFRMMGIPMHELFDMGYDAREFFGCEMGRINEKLQDISNLEKGKEIVEKFLLDRVARLRDILPVDYALHMLLNKSGHMTMDEVASISCLSLKQFERKCQERIGMNPKLFARILRFSKAYRLHEAFPQMSWIRIAYEAGYYDQMHMIRDFKVFAGVNPSIIGEQLLSTPLRMQKDLRC